MIQPLRPDATGIFAFSVIKRAAALVTTIAPSVTTGFAGITPMIGKPRISLRSHSTVKFGNHDTIALNVIHGKTVKFGITERILFTEKTLPGQSIQTIGSTLTTLTTGRHRIFGQFVLDRQNRKSRHNRFPLLRCLFPVTL